MEPKDAIKSQYQASLAMFQRVVENYPDDYWPGTGHQNPTWQLAYHALFYTHLYIHPSEEDFVPWEKARPGLNSMGPRPESDDEAPGLDQPFSRGEILDYARLVQEGIDAWVDSLNLDGPSGFYWLPMTKFELQFYNIRHLMQHTGELAERLWVEARVGTDWVGKG